jgi:tripeptidyl-peptidase II
MSLKFMPLKPIFLILLVLNCATTGFTQTRPKGQPESASTPQAPSRQGVTTESTWSFLSLEACGIETFLKKYPTADGRGTIIAILDDGVDPGLAGLLKTSEGKPKIIDVQDFSGTGNLYWTRATRNGNELLDSTAKNVVLSGLENIKAYNDIYFYAALDEKRFQNGLEDLNFNAKQDDIFGVVVFEDEPGHWSAVVDGDADKDIKLEPVLTTYRERRDLFRFRAASSDTIADTRYLSGAVNIFPDEKRINLYFADGGHGTHVAGMAAGYSIDAQTGFNGVAPGAEVVALKFSDNTQSGITVSGSMKASYEYVVRLAHETGKPVISNMSFGIGSEIEGESAMDIWLDSLLDANPDVVVCISGSNDGPGLSNIGLPGSARTAITSGAALPDDTGRDLYGVNMSRPIIWDFSSRGGELAKPDIVSPGTAISTVPDYVMNDRYNGTSMASPFTTGCCAVLISAMQQQFPGYKPDAYLIKRALQMGAKPLAGYTPLDQGAGMINVPRAFEYLSGWHRKGTAPREYVVEAHMPASNVRGTSAYYRSGIFPQGADRTTFHIKPIADKGKKTREEILGFNAYVLRSDASWLEPIQSSIYRRGIGQLEVSVRYDEKQLTKPGLYVGKVLAYPKGIAGEPVPEFELWNTVIIPHRFQESNAYTIHLDNFTMRGSELRREFFKVPAGAAGIRFTLERHGDKVISGTLFDNDGRGFAGLNIPKDRTLTTKMITGEEVPGGVIELVLKGGLGDEDEKEGTFELTVEVFPVDIKVSLNTINERGEAKAIVSVKNASPKEIDLDFTAGIEGYERLIDTVIKGTDEFLLPFRVNAGDETVVFVVELSRKDYNLFTDIALQILGPNGEAIVNNAFDERSAKAEMKLHAKDTTEYHLHFRGGLAVPNRGDSFRLLIRERRLLEKGLELRADPSNVELAPSQEERFRVFSTQPQHDIPLGYNLYGSINGKLKNGEKLVVPLSF